MRIDTPHGPVIVADNPHDLLAGNYFQFQQAWAQQMGIGSDMYAQDGHLARLGGFIHAGEKQAALTEYNHTLLGFTNLTSAVPVSYQAQALACLTLSINGQRCIDFSKSGLEATAGRLLEILTQGQLEEVLEESKKNFAPR